MKGEDVGSAHEEVRAIELTLRVAGQLGHVFLDFPSLCSPGEVCVGLREAELGQPLHHLGPREGLRQEKHVGIARLHFSYQPLPKAKWLRVGVIDTENLDALCNPKKDDVPQ